MGLLGVTDSALLDDMTDSLAVGDAAGVYATIDRVVEAGHDPRRFAADLLDRFRDLIVLDSVPDAVDKGLIDYAGDQASRLADQSRRIGLASLVRFADITHTTLTDMRGTTSPRLMLELLSARMLLPDASADSAALLQRLERLERRQQLTAQVGQAQVGQGGAGTERPPAARAEPPKAEPPKAEQPKAEPAQGRTSPKPNRSGMSSPKPNSPKAEPVPAQAAQSRAARTSSPEAEPRPEPAASTAPADTGLDQIAATAPPVVLAEAATDSTALRQLWPEVMAALRDRSKVKWAMMNEVVIASVEGEVVNLLAPAGLARRIADESNLSVLREVLQSVVFGHWQLTISPAAPSAGSPAHRAAPEPDEPPNQPDQTQPDPAPRAGRPERAPRPERPRPSARRGRLPPNPPAARQRLGRTTTGWTRTPTRCTPRNAPGVTPRPPPSSCCRPAWVPGRSTRRDAGRTGAVTGEPVRICFVCTGNICRSPTAEVVLRAQLSKAGLADRVAVDSAGTAPWHAGKDMDARARHALSRRGYPAPVHAARQFQAVDFTGRDLVIALDAGHLARLGQLARLAADPGDAAASLSLLRSYDPAAVAAGELEVGDPYYHGEPEYELALTQIEAACVGLVGVLRRQFGGSFAAQG